MWVLKPQVKSSVSSKHRKKCKNECHLPGLNEWPSHNSKYKWDALPLRQGGLWRTMTLTRHQMFERAVSRCENWTSDSKPTMSEGKRKYNGADNKRTKRYRSVSLQWVIRVYSLNERSPKDGTPIWEKRRIEGPGIWVTCMFDLLPRHASESAVGVKGKEKQAAGEICEVFESVSFNFLGW